MKKERHPMFWLGLLFFLALLALGVLLLLRGIQEGPNVPQLLRDMTV